MSNASVLAMMSKKRWWRNDPPALLDIETWKDLRSPSDDETPDDDHTTQGLQEVVQVSNVFVVLDLNALNCIAEFLQFIDQRTSRLIKPYIDQRTRMAYKKRVRLGGGTVKDENDYKKWKYDTLRYQHNMGARSGLPYVVAVDRYPGSDEKDIVVSRSMSMSSPRSKFRLGS